MADDRIHSARPCIVGSQAQRSRDRSFLHTLGLIPPCTVEDVKQAYLAKVKTAHPDVGGDPAEFRKLQEAYERATEWAKFRASRIQWLSNWVEKYVEQDALVAEIRTARRQGADRRRRLAAAIVRRRFFGRRRESAGHRTAPVPRSTITPFLAGSHRTALGIAEVAQSCRAAPLPMPACSTWRHFRICTNSIFPIPKSPAPACTSLDACRPGLARLAQCRESAGSPG